MRLGFYKLVLGGVLLATVLSTGLYAKEVTKEASRDGAPGGTIGQIALGALPKQGRETWRLILQGGPFPYEKDGTVFGNRERLLPGAKRGWYREYTVPTPGLKHRGARRIVCGGVPTVPDACYWTDDHYASFRRIVP